MKKRVFKGFFGENCLNVICWYLNEKILIFWNIYIYEKVYFMVIIFMLVELRIFLENNYIFFFGYYF